MKKTITNLLLSQWYKSYALILNSLNLKISKSILGCTDWKTITIKEWLDNNTISLIIRHEILHWLLSHNELLKKWYNHEKINISWDLELSNFYSKLDNDITNKLGWFSVNQDNYCKYKQWNIIDIYNDLPDEEGNEQNKEIEQENEFLDLSNLSKEEKEAIKKEIKEEVKNINNIEQINNIEIYRSLSSKERFINQIKRYFIKEEQIQKVSSYKRNNKKYNNSDLIFKSKQNKNAPWRTLCIYCDLSWSMSTEKINKASSFINWIQNFKRVKLIKKYFSDNVYDKEIWWWWTNYLSVFEDIKEHKYSDICIITDDDSYNNDLSIELKSAWIIRINCQKTKIEDYIEAKNKFYLNY